MPSANIDWNTYKITNMGAGSGANDSVRLVQIQQGGLIYAEAGGTADAITLTTTPTFAAVEGTAIFFFAEADNTTTTTVALNGGSALALQVGGSACVGGEVNNGQGHIVQYDGTQWQLLNPYWSALITRASLGLATTDSPMFTAIQLGHASDTTITRVSAGLIAVEGVTLLDVTAAAATYQPLDSDLTAIAALSTTSTGRSLLAAANAAAIATIAGVGTGDSPQFTAINVGNASDTTITRVSAGLLAVEGNTIPTVGTQQEWTKQQNFDAQALTDGANIAWDLDTQQVAKVTLGGNRTLSAPSNKRDGGDYRLIITQDGTGSRTLSFNSAYKFEFGVAPTLSTGIGDIDVLVCVSDGTNLYCRLAQDFS